MDRQILFRAKSIEDDTKGQWIYGFYREFKTNKGITYFIDSGDSNESFFVDKATIGQYTGLNDKNGKKIFEGDKAKWVRFKDKETGIVRYNSRMACFEFMVKHCDGHINSYLIGHCESLEVTGTIFDIGV
ncbi:MAG: YopX family protein [Hydrogenoanaerobacterium sp.]